MSSDGEQPKNEAGFNLNSSVPAVSPSSLPSTSGNGAAAAAAAAAVPSDALDLPGVPHRWRIVIMMAVAFVLCNMDKVRCTSNYQVARGSLLVRLFILGSTRGNPPGWWHGINA